MTCTRRDLILLATLQAAVSLRIAGTSAPKPIVSRPPVRPSSSVSSSPAGSEIVNPICPPATPGVPYWYDPRIHVFGNVGLSGFFHAFSAPLATAIIDKLSYGGLDVRKLSHQLIDPVGEKSVLDMACGVGFSTMPGAHAIDTSNEMLSIARWRRPDVNFRFGNAETYGARTSPCGGRLPDCPRADESCTPFPQARMLRTMW